MKTATRVGSAAILTGLFLAAKTAFAAPVTLDFSSGTFSARPPLSYVNMYQQDGFTVTTQSVWDEFSMTGGTYGPTLDWYNASTVIRFDRGGGLFNLDSVDIPIPAYAGLVFESSTGAMISLGSGTGTRLFPDAGWSGINYFTVRKLTSVDILTEIDNVVVNPVPVPTALTLFLSGLAGLAAMKKHRATRRG